MKLKIFALLLVSNLFVTSCRSRFTSTSDSTGPRRHIYADGAGHEREEPGAGEKAPGQDDRMLTEIRDSGNAPIMNAQDSVSAMSNSRSPNMDSAVSHQKH
ncbi:MAG: hypothetical protein ABIO05_04745 [Ferruginibacter sp.]